MCVYGRIQMNNISDSLVKSAFTLTAFQPAQTSEYSQCIPSRATFDIRKAQHGNKCCENDAGATASGETSATPDYIYNIRMAPLEFTRQQLVESKIAVTKQNLHIYK